MNLWHRFSDWRRQRATLSELKRLAREEEAYLSAIDLNPVYLAKLAVERGDLSAAESRWERARELLPNFIVESKDSLGILLALKRYEEAEHLLTMARKKYPRDQFYAIGLAEVAERRGDLEGAIERWEEAQDGPAKAMTIARRGACFRSMGQLDKAEALFDEAIRLDPELVFAWLERAKLGELREDWPSSLLRWRELAGRFNFGPGFSGQARALAELGRLDEAEALLSLVLPNNPRDLEMAVTRAHLATRRGDFAAASGRWADVRNINPDFAPGFRDGARSLFSAGQHDEADQLLRRAIERFPQEVWPLHDFARFAHERHDWPEAVARWHAFRQRFPGEEAGYTMGREAFAAAGRHEDAEALRTAAVKAGGAV